MVKQCRLDTKIQSVRHPPWNKHKERRIVIPGTRLECTDFLIPVLLSLRQESFADCVDQD